MELLPEKYSYKVMGIIMATFIDKSDLHDVSMYLKKAFIIYYQKYLRPFQVLCKFKKLI